jgi:hypothetical protein
MGTSVGLQSRGENRAIPKMGIKGSTPTPKFYSIHGPPGGLIVKESQKSGAWGPKSWGPNLNVGPPQKILKTRDIKLKILEILILTRAIVV